MSIYVFHCAEPGPLPRAFHLNEIDVSDTATHSQTRTYTNGGKKEINVPLLAFIWLLLGDGLLSRGGNQMQKQASGFQLLRLHLLVGAGTTMEHTSQYCPLTEVY